MKKDNENVKGFTVKDLMKLAESINKKAQMNKDYRKVVDAASEKWENTCCYGFK